MTARAAVSGFYFAHPEASYFSLGKIAHNQLKAMPHARACPWTKWRAGSAQPGGVERGEGGKPMETVHVRAVVQPDGSLHIGGLPFRPGEEVEVTVQTQPHASPFLVSSALAGTVLKYLDPT